MNTDNLLPQFNRGNIETPIGFFKTLFRLHEMGREGVLPAIVEAYDRANGIVYVKPLAKHAATDVDNNEVLEDRPTYKVHAARFMHGGFVIDAPIYKGDTGWIVAGDRNCSGAISENSTVLDAPQSDEDQKNKGSARPSDNSLASFAWGFFIPDSWGNNKYAESDGLVIAGDAGKIEIRKDGIYIDDVKLSVKTLTYKTEDEESSVSFLASDDLTIEGGGGGGIYVDGDGKSISKVPDAPEGGTPTGDEGKLEIKGFSAAANSSAPYKDGDELVWGGKAITSAETSGGEVTVEFADGDSIALKKVATSGSYDDLEDKPDLATVATSGSYDDLEDKPTLADVATSGDYDDLTNKPTIPTVNDGTLTVQLAGTTIGTFSANQSSNATLNFTQKTLVAGSNITLATAGDTITISASSSGGSSSTSGYTTPSGSEDVTIAAMRYDVENQQLQVKYCRETYENGLLKTRSVDSAWSIIEGGQAVQETV